MLIETYEIEELTTETRPGPEVEAEAIALSERLGLKGQMALVRPAVAEAGDAVRIPYPQMTKVQRAVYGALFPEETAIEKFDCDLIPLRVLQVVDRCKTREIFEAGIWVWHPDVPKPDPILVGRTGKNYAWKHYLLARWGSALKPFAELAADARVALRERYVASLEKAISDARAKLAGVDGLVAQALAGGYVSVP